jgi:glutamate/tyrosine decarboxylase-like PLP-dependent enzyme
MASTLLVAPLYHFIGSLTPIGRGVLMIKNLLVDILFFLVPYLFHGNLESNALLLTPPLKQSIKLWLMVLLRFFGYAIF